jgi:NADH:ubiquinone oxidoreductase subunit F (NADH-binding)/NAD-dependent dihydropyrimidine dehydrogenase PreA subunit
MTAISGSPLERYQALRERADAAYAAWRQPERPRIDVAIDTSSLANGARRTGVTIANLVNERNAAVDLGQVHGYGMQWLQPLVQITFPDGASVLYGPVRPEDAAAIVDEATGRPGAAPRGAQSTAEHLRIGTVFEERAGVRSLRDHPYFALEPRERRLLRNIGLIDPDSLDHCLARDGYRAIARVLDRGQTQEGVRQELIDAGLTGRGGAAFPAGVKWNFLAGAPGDEKYMVCNADEGDPGAWVNRVVMEGDPHLLIEGMLIASFASNAPKGFIYVRDEYPLAIARLEHAVREAEAAGLLGDDVLGTGLNFELRVIRGAGAYVCGEETGLLASIQGDRGMPRVKPPFPAQSGVFFKPSNVNNVETYANAPLILLHGHEWYNELGTEQNRGTRIFSFSGDIPYVGFMELPFGTPVPAVLQACGGIQGGALKAIQSGGPLGSLVPASAVPDLVLENQSFVPLDAMMGAGGIVFCSDRTSVIVMNEYISAFVEDESCGRCTTCHHGNQRMTEIFHRIMDGNGRREDAHNLELLDRTLQSSNCVHGQFSPKVMRNTLQHFRADFDAAIAGDDPSLTVAGLYHLKVVDQRDQALAEAVDICPVDAFRGGPGNYSIDDQACIRCGACLDVAPRAIAREAKPRAPRMVALT